MPVDDFLFWAKDEKDISELAMRLCEEEMDLEQEDDAAGFLGVRLKKSESSGLIEMKQTGLINRIIEALGLDKGTVNGKFTPAEANPLVKDEDGPSASGDISIMPVLWVCFCTWLGILVLILPMQSTVVPGTCSVQN
jgi:hypothetical protein